MFKTVSGNKKLVGLLVVALILLLSSFKKSFKPTFETYKQQQEVEEKLVFTKGALSSINNLRSEVTILNNRLGAIDLKPQEVQQQLLYFASQLENVDIVDVDEIHYATNPLFKIYTHQIVLDGEFQKLLYALYDFEKKFSVSRIVNFSFDSRKKNGRILQKQRLTITFQNYEKNK